MDNFTKISFGFVGLAAALIAFILAIRIVWRVEKRLQTFFKILTVVIALIAFQQLFYILEVVDVISSGTNLNILDGAGMFVLIIGLAVMNRIITDMDGER